MKRIVLFAVLIISTFSCFAQNRKVNLHENLPLDEVLKMGKKENKLLFLDFGSLTCLPCMYLKKKVFTIDSVADFINQRFVSVDYNVGEEKKRLSKIYGVDSEPVLLILDQQGNLMHRMVGKCEGDELLKRFRQGLDTANNLAAQNKQYASGKRSTEFLKSYVQTLLIARHTDKMNEVVKQLLAGPLEQLYDKNVFDIFLKYNDNPVSREMLYVFDNRDSFSTVFGKSTVENKINRHYSAKSSSYIFGHKPPIEDSNFVVMLHYLQLTDYEKATNWLCYLVPAQYKFKDWVAMAKAIDNAIEYNILKGKERDYYMKMMAEQLCWYSNDKNALPYAIKWIDDLMKITNDTSMKESILKTKQQLINKLEGKQSEGTVESNGSSAIKYYALN